MTQTTLEAAKEQVRRIIGLLGRSGEAADGACAARLEDELSSMDGRFGTKEALFRIGESCHPKALGDRFIPGLSDGEWRRELEVLEGRCAAAFDELERARP
ncbi:MAG: hypothetical protein HYV14_13505 [Elusimicrobia bacterium]|nr:hypothetical protein [Elusimicrobiota bacterium]